MKASGFVEQSMVMVRWCSQKIVVGQGSGTKAVYVGLVVILLGLLP